MSNQYSNEQLINALVKEYEYLIHDDYQDDVDPTPEQYLDSIKDLSYDELVEEAQVDEHFTLDEFMKAYG